MAVDVDVVNEALALVGFDGAPVTGNAPSFDSSTSGKIASRIYVPAVQAVARQFEWDFSRQIASLSLSGNAAPFPWSYEYLYPALAVQLWQVTPPSLTDANDPKPVNFVVGNAQVASVSTKVIWSNLASAVAVFANQPGPNVWDPAFREAVVRLLASEMAVAIAGKPDTARDLFEQSGSFAGIGAGRPG